MIPRSKSEKLLYFHYNMNDNEISKMQTYLNDPNLVTASFNELRNFNPEQELIPDGRPIKIIIDAHGTHDERAKKYIADKITGEKELMTIGELVNLLKPYLKNLNEDNYFSNKCDPPLINLIICYAAHDQESVLNSFAGKLQKELAAEGVYVNINARVSPVKIKGNAKYTTKHDDFKKIEHLNNELNELATQINNIETNNKHGLMKLYLKKADEISKLIQHQAPGSKYTFLWIKDNENSPLKQVAVESYWLKERKKCLERIEKYLLRIEEFIINLPKNKELSDTHKDQILTELSILANKLSNFLLILNSMVDFNQNDFKAFKENMKDSILTTQKALIKINSTDLASFSYSIGKFFGEREDYSQFKNDRFFSEQYIDKFLDLTEDLSKQLDNIRISPNKHK